MKLNTCHHSFDNGSFCKSPALRGRDYCCFHLNHRGRLMRIARKRAQNERLFLTLPPLENMHAVQSALSQVLEAVAADMIDLKRAQFLLTGLRHAASNFKNPKAWQPSAYVKDPEAPGLEEYPDFEAEYDLPNDLNLATPPEAAFPPPSVSLSEEVVAATAESKGPCVSAHPVAGAPTASFADSANDSFSAARALELVNEPLQTTPADIELEEVMKKYGYKEWETRANEHQRNERRRKRRQNFRANYARYEAEAKARNVQRAAEQLLREKLAADQAAASPAPAVDASSSDAGHKKAPISAAAGASQSPSKEVKNTA